MASSCGRSCQSPGSGIMARLAEHSRDDDPLVRLGVHPGDVTVPATLSSIRRTVAKIARTHVPSQYRDMVGDLACAS